MVYDQLKLSNQLCFPAYAASRLIIREYQPYLDELGITYPQYLVLMVLWEDGAMTVNEITKKLMLNTNTVTPLLKRMMNTGILTRLRSQEDERKVIVELTEKGIALQEKAANIPLQLMGKLTDKGMSTDELVDLKKKLERVIELLSGEK